MSPATAPADRRTDPAADTLLALLADGTDPLRLVTLLLPHLAGVDLHWLKVTAIQREQLSRTTNYGSRGAVGSNVVVGVR